MAQQLTTREATAILGVSERHTWRMLAAYRKEGAAALAHGNRGRRPRNAVPEETRRKVIALARTRYAGFNHTHLAEIIAEREGMVVSRSTVRSILLSAGLPSPRYRRPPLHRHRRQRMPQEGMLLQLDGSYHAWLEDRGPWLTLLLAVDDATGTVPYGVLREREDTRGTSSCYRASSPDMASPWACTPTATPSSSLRGRGLKKSPAPSALLPPNGAVPCGSSA